MKKSSRLIPLLLTISAICLASCGHRSAETKLASPPGENAATHTSAPHARAEESLLQPARPKAAAADEGEAAGARAEPSFRRPGLATQWGEERHSRIREVPFHRQSASPLDIVSIHYDDEDGVRAATYRNGALHSAVFPVRGGALTVSVVDSSGDPLPSVFHGERAYVVGDSGDRYQLHIQNHTPGRFEVVSTVDGLDVVDGQDGALDKRGYLIDPWGTLTIEGFRDSYETVRAFRFGDVESSYAIARGRGANIGVIGVAVFAEEGFYLDDEIRRRRGADPFPGRFAPAPSY